MRINLKILLSNNILPILALNNTICGDALEINPNQPGGEGEMAPLVYFVFQLFSNSSKFHGIW